MNGTVSTITPQPGRCALPLVESAEERIGVLVAEQIGARGFRLGNLRYPSARQYGERRS